MNDEAPEISVLAELEHLGLAYEWSGDQEVRCLCPFHEDKTPSCCVNVSKRVFKCHVAGCNANGDFISFIARYLKTSRAVVVADLSTRYNFEADKVIDPDAVERWHNRIWAAKPLLQELYKRGVTNDDIRQYRLGEDQGRITIPVKNEAGYFVNIRKYLPGAPGKQKMRNARGRGKERLYPVDQIKYDRIMLCGGEMKAIVAARQLNPHGIGGITTTSGEENMSPELLLKFTGKVVYICLDVDKAGVKAAEDRARQLCNIAAEVYIIRLPLDTNEHPKGDINDFVGQKNGDVYSLLTDLTRYEPSAVTLVETEPESVSLCTAVNASYASRRVRVNAVVAAMDTAPYVIPKDVKVVCDRSQKDCAVCPIYSGSDLHTIHPESSALLEFVSARKSQLREAIMNGLHIPRTCAVAEFETISYYNAEDVRLSPQLEITNRSADRLMQPAICLGPGLELNEAYNLIGRMWPHPVTQQSTLLISAYEPTKDALSTYKCDDLDELKVFQPAEWTLEALNEKLNHIYDDFEANVTRIFERRDLHVMIDLAYHSPLFITFDNRIVKGWVEVLIVGDSAQGKSETALNMMQHYGLGEKVECKNASVAGLLGGLQQMGSRWFVTWGVIPTHDKRLVIFEEVKGASTDVIGKLTDMRSSGVAEIPKIEKRRTHARTRGIWLSNPRSDRQLSTYNFGIQAIKELIGGLEDIRRFDAALIVAASDIDASVLNKLQRNRPHVHITYTSALCRSLILWCWTREAKQVIINEDVCDLILTSATALSDEFSDAIPLVDRGSSRYKIARLAAALAGRTFSADDDLNLVVRQCHVQFVVEYLQRVYRFHSFGYKDYTEASQIGQNLLDPTAILKQLNDLPFPSDFVKSILHTNHVDLQDIQDWTGWDRMQSTQLMSFFVRKHALVRSGRTYHKSPNFIRLLKDAVEQCKLVERPSFIKEPEF